VSSGILFLKNLLEAMSKVLKQAKASSNGNGAASQMTLRKRKADVSPTKPKANEATKRSALGEVTNRASKAGNAVAGKGLLGLKGVNTNTNTLKSNKPSLEKKPIVKVNVKMGEIPKEKVKTIAGPNPEVKKEAEVKEEAKTVAESLTDVMNARNAKVTEEIKIRLPDGVADFDGECLDDPFQVSEYVFEIFEYYKRREAKFQISKYLSLQTELNRNMRAILVDWMVEVQESFELNHETLYLAVKLVDLYLTKSSTVKRDKLQLIGATAMFLAAKYDERSPPVIDDFCYICDDAYSQKDVLQMEVHMLKTLGFDIGVPLSYRFLRRYARCAKLEMETLTLARYILEMSLADYDFIDTSDSLIASACLLLALTITGVPDAWTPTLEYYSGYNKNDIFDLCHRLFNMVRNPQSSVKTITAKYSHKVFYAVAKTPLPEELKL
jgi:cyclin B